MSTSFRRISSGADAAILDSLSLAVMVVDPTLHIIRFNEPAEELTGHAAEDVLGRICSDVLKASLCNGRCPVRETLRTGATCRFRSLVLQTRARQPLTVDVTASALTDSSGAVLGAVSILRDVARDPGLMRLYASREFVSRSDTMRRIFEALPELAASDAPLLIVGGCGSGRSALGETIHGLGPGRDGKPLLRLTCPSPDSPKRLVDILTDQHLSDHGGTLLLEELCGARLALQQRLLAWIEDGTPGALRLISTATERLETCLKKGAFRRDLFHRLNVLHVEVPTLRERPEDIPLLVEQLLEGLNQKRGRQIQGVTPAAAARLQQADYPGNVRQLRMVLDEAHRKCRSSFIDVEDLPDLALVCPTCNDATAQQAVLDALDRAGGNLTHAARELGIHRTTLWRKLKRLEQAGGSEDPDAENH